VNKPIEMLKRLADINKIAANRGQSDTMRAYFLGAYDTYLFMIELFEDMDGKKI